MELCHESSHHNFSFCLYLYGFTEVMLNVVKILHKLLGARWFSKTMVYESRICVLGAVLLNNLIFSLWERC